MVRLILLLLAITACSLGAVWLADEPGHVAVDWGSYHFDASLLTLLALTALFALACLVLYQIAFSLLRAPRHWQRARLAKRQTKGLEALTSAFAAIATQDMRQARRQIGRAQHYLPQQPLTLMLSSQLARLEGNESQSRLYLEQMLKSEGTEYMALRGLIETARRNGDDRMALLHAEKALTLKSRDPWLVTTLIGLYAREGRIREALGLAQRAGRQKIVDRSGQRMLSAQLYYEQALKYMGERRFDLAAASLKDALRHQPDFAAASAHLSACAREEGDMLQALKIITGGWKYAPHPLLTQELLACFQSARIRDKVVRMAEKLARMHPTQAESRVMIAAVALKNGDTEIARNELFAILETGETARLCLLIAEAEQADGNATAAQQWMKRAQDLPPEITYRCDACRQPVSPWQLTCPHCASVGTVEWK